MLHARRAQHVMLLICVSLWRTAAQDDLALLDGDMTLVQPTEFKPSKTTCEFAQRTYKLGDIWHPRLEGQNFTYCVTCKCQLVNLESQYYNTTCSSEPCPVACDTPGNEYCCQFCEADRKRKNRTIARSMAPEPTDVAPPVVCRSGGHQFQEGQKFVPNKTLTLLRPEFPNECVLCVCGGGVVECKVVNCTRPACSQPIVSSDNCCPICPPTVRNEEIVPFAGQKIQLPVWTTEIGQKNKRGNSCLVGEKQYMEGENWHPIIGPFGPMYCITCQCKSGRVECSRWCPDQSQLPCTQPVRLPGHCCESCPPQVQAMPASPPHQQKTFADKLMRQLNICLPPGRDVLVYRSKKQSLKGDNAVEMIQFAFSNRYFKGLELYTWKLRGGTISTFFNETKPVFNQDFQQMAIQYHLSTLGATTNENLEIFKMRGRKINRKCKSNCGAKIERTLQKLQTIPVARRATCLPDEIKI